MSAAPFLVNGEQRDSVCAADRGFQYGAGLFETIAIRDGRPRLWDYHWDRLCTGCERLGLPIPGRDLVEDEIRRLGAARRRAVAKLVLTRGVGGRGYRPSGAMTPTRVLSLHPWPDYPEHFARDGVRVILCRTRLAGQPVLAGIKHLNRLEQVLARMEWDDPEIAEGLLRDEHGNFLGGTMSNLFVVRDGGLLTADVGRAGVAGVMRRLIMKLARAAGIDVDVGEIRRDQIDQADEIFLSNALIGIWPVAQLGQRRLPKGKLTGDLQGRLGECGILA